MRASDRQCSPSTSRGHRDRPVSALACRDGAAHSHAQQDAGAPIFVNKPPMRWSAPMSYPHDRQVIADAAYLHESITEPHAAVADDSTGGR